MADGVRAAQIAHSLKGSSATFGAIRMAGIAARLGGLDPSCLLQEAETVLADLAPALVATEVALKRAADTRSD